ncbi:MAG TPA: hypothetical protein VGG98_09425 [Solirubrobacteraceae bacterium]|jgi:beta-lactamase superfamily II metal-dependent hydrolase
MSFLTYYGEDRPFGPAPRRVYGRIDSREGPGAEAAGPSTILIDSVDADWFDERGREAGWLAAPETREEADRNVSILHAPERDVPGGLLARWMRHRGEERWIEIEFTDGEDVEHYLNLFGAPLMRGSGPWRTVPAHVEAQLERATGLDALPGASREQLIEALGRVGDVEALAVYDVGHGACSALLAPWPALYFDFGGGVKANRNTFPTALRRFCMSEDPPIVLSHWDFDHWSSAQRDIRALKLTWIVPRQPIGAVHTVMLGALLAEGHVLVWPRDLGALDVGAVRIEACTGPRSSRNDSGLAMILTHPDGSQMLLPGDCRYDSIPSARGRFASIVVPHHGGRTRSKFVPTSDGRAAGRCVYSVGDPNQWDHPFPSVLADHAGVYAAELFTAVRAPEGLGHVHLYWDESQSEQLLGCGGGECDLRCTQR